MGLDAAFISVPILFTRLTSILALVAYTLLLHDCGITGVLPRVLGLADIEGLEVSANREAWVAVLHDGTIFIVIKAVTGALIERSCGIMLLDWTLAAKVVSLTMNGVVLNSNADLALIKSIVEAVLIRILLHFVSCDSSWSCPELLVREVWILWLSRSVVNLSLSPLLLLDSIDIFFQPLSGFSLFHESFSVSVAAPLNFR